MGKMELPQLFGEIEEDIIEEFDAELVSQSHQTADLLAKRGYRVKKPVWNGLMAS